MKLQGVMGGGGHCIHNQKVLKYCYLFIQKAVIEPYLKFVKSFCKFMLSFVQSKYPVWFEFLSKHWVKVYM